MSNKKILQGHNKALESLATIAGIPIKKSEFCIDEIIPTTDISLNPYASSAATKIPHSLGKTPSVVAILATGLGDLVTFNLVSLYATKLNSVISQQNDELFATAVYERQSFNSAYNTQVVANDTEVSIMGIRSSGYGFKLCSGVKYYLLTQ